MDECSKNCFQICGNARKRRRKPRVFRPLKIPRYLPGSVKKQVLQIDLHEFNNHRYKVFTAKTKTDHFPPKMSPFDYIDQRKLSTDAERLHQIDKQNKHLLKCINLVNRTIGRVHSYNPEAYAWKSKWYGHEKRMKLIEANNKQIFDKLQAAGSSYGVKKLNICWQETIKKIKLQAKYPLVVLQKVSADAVLRKQPSISAGLEQLAERPKCFLEFSVTNGLFLGRVEILLYHDHVPVTIQNFMGLCSGEKKHHYKNCTIYRIVPGRYLETGDVTLDNGRGGASIYGKRFAEEGHKLKHTKAGVLSMVRVGKHSNNSKFCITFASMETLDNQNVVFGKIVKGAEHLFKIEGYGRRIGKPLLPITISNCGYCYS